MADKTDELVFSVLLDKKYDFVVVVSKSSTIRELRSEIDSVAREVFPEFSGGKVWRVETQRGSVLPDRYKVGIVLRGENRIICYSSGGKEKENVKNLRSQQLQTSETVRNKPSVSNNTSKHSLLEAKRTVSDNVCGSSEDMLSASKYKTLFTVPEHCHPKRKEAIEMSACKVAEWLSIHDVSSSVDAQDSQSDEGTMEVESESVDQPKQVEGKRVEKRVETVTSINRKGDDEDDHVDDIGYDIEEDDGSYSEDDNSENRDVCMAESLNDNKRETAKTTTCDTPLGVNAKKDACVSVATIKSKRRIDEGVSKKNEALSMTSRVAQSNLPLSESDREKRSTNSSALPSLAANLPNCQIKLKKLRLCITHGRNVKVKQCKTRHQTNKSGDVMSNRGSEDNDGDNDEDDVESDEVTPQRHKTRLIVADVYGDEKDGASKTALSMLDIQTNGRLDEDTEGENKESTPIYLTQIKNGEQISWLKERNREGDFESLFSDCSILVENDGQQSMSDRSIISENTTEGNMRLEFTSQSPIKKRSEQKQRKLQESKDTVEENVNEESVEDRRIISENTTEGNTRLEFTSQSPIKKRSEQKQRKLQESEDTVEENVIEQSVEDRRIIPENTTERNTRLEFTSQSPIKKRSEQKQRKLQESKDTVEENVNEESVEDRRIIPENTTEGNTRLEFTSQSPIKKRSEQKQRKLQESEDTVEENVNEESVEDRRIISENTTEGNMRLEFTSQSPIKKRSEQKQRKLQESEDTVEENVNKESVEDRRIISENTTEGNTRLEFTSQSPIKKRSEQKQRKLQESKDTVEENVNEESVEDRRIIPENTTEGNTRLEFTSQSPIKKRSEQKQRKLQESEDTVEENVNEQSVDGTAITSKKRSQTNVELECAMKDDVDNNNNIKTALKRKADKRKWGVRRESDSRESVGMETPKKIAREDGCCEDRRNDECNKTDDRITVEGACNISDGLQEGKQTEMLKKKKKKKTGKRKKKSVLSGTENTPESTAPLLEKVELPQRKADQHDERVERELATNVKNKESNCDLLQKQGSLASIGGKNFKKKDRYCEEKRSEDDEKSNGRRASNQVEKVDSMSDQLQKETNAQQSKKKKTKKERNRKVELNSMESATELPLPSALETVTSDSLDVNKSKQHEQCVPGQDESVHQPRISKKRTAAANQEKETLSGQGLQSSEPDADFSQQKTNSKKKSKTSLSLLDLALDDTAEQGGSNKASNRKTVRSEGRPAHQVARHFRQTPKGFLHSAKNRKTTASTSTIVIRRKPRINPKAILEMTAKEKDLVTSGVSFGQLLDDESLWNT